MREVLVGAATWQVTEWEQAFYPEDMPDEWRLSFYANEYFTTIIPCQKFIEASAEEDIVEMLEDCHERFHPVLAIPFDLLTSDAIGQCIASVLGSDAIQEDAVSILVSDVGATDPPDNIIVFRNNLPENIAVTIDLSHINQGAMVDSMIHAGMAPVLYPDDDPDDFQSSWLAYVSLNEDDKSIARRLQEIIASRKLSGNQQLHLLALDGYEDVDALNRLSTMVRLIAG